MMTMTTSVVAPPAAGTFYRVLRYSIQRRSWQRPAPAPWPRQASALKGPPRDCPTRTRMRQKRARKSSLLWKRQVPWRGSRQRWHPPLPWTHRLRVGSGRAVATGRSGAAAARRRNRRIRLRQRRTKAMTTTTTARRMGRRTPRTIVKARGDISQAPILMTSMQMSMQLLMTSLSGWQW